MEIPNIPAEKYFYARDGQVIRSLHELPEALRNMSPEAFSHHVSAEKNDFHSWVVDVFNNSSVARKIKSAKTKETMAKRVFNEIHG